jgi:DNA repair exonuclease SbcCD ATPase subunit
MIHFTKLRWKNFLSTGNTFTEIHLDRSPSTLIVGHNGAGKSTMLDALSFALFGKPHRDIKKLQLVNSINNRDALVEVEFTISNVEFKVVRGIKPNKFEIWQNGKMVDQSSTSRDYQKFLEQNILKLNHKSFHQVVVLGSSSFIPFMQLPTYHRREVIEDLLDIQIFGKMNQILKEQSQRLKEDAKDNKYRVELVKDKIGLQKDYIREIADINDGQISDKRKSIEESQSTITGIQESNAALSLSIEESSNGLKENISNAQSKKQSLLKYKAQFEQQIKSVVKDAKFYENNEQCPTCEQDIAEELRQDKLETAHEKARELNKAVIDASSQSAAVETNILELDSISEKVREDTSELTLNNKEISRLQKQITALEKDITKLTSKEGDLGEANSKLTRLSEERDSLTERKLELSEQKTYQEAVGEMLKDSGIKTKVIKQYLPVMNKLINHYLQVMDFYVSFNLDESFTETIKSRFRDSFNYASFSEGEKQRIDLALLFTWRQIARMKNSASSNLLILDETFDSSLDNDGIENLLKILETLEEGTNTFIISHKGDVLDGKFRSKIEFTKERNFSKIK